MATQPFEFPKYESQPVEVNASDDGQMSGENLSDLLGRVSKTSSVEIEKLIGDFEGLRSKLQTDRERIQREIEEYDALSQQVIRLKTDRERIQREIEEYDALSQQVMQLTKIISEGVQKTASHSEIVR